MSAGGLFARTSEREEARSEKKSVRRAGGWNQEDFAREQIRGLVRQVFFSNVDRPVRQVVFTAVEPETDVRNICRQVGEALALETEESIAVVGEYPHILQDAETDEGMLGQVAGDGSMPLRRDAIRLRGYLWLVAPAGKDGDRVTTALLHSYLSEIRREFEYSIVEGPPAPESNQARAMAHFADGVVLVLSAHRTRRIMALKIKQALEAAQARLLGTVLSERVFPIPEAIYRRL